jgi:hypothetical protein
MRVRYTGLLSPLYPDLSPVAKENKEATHQLGAEVGSLYR